MRICKHLLTKTCPWAYKGACCNSIRKPTHEEIQELEINNQILDYLFEIKTIKQFKQTIEVV